MIKHMAPLLLLAALFAMPSCSRPRTTHVPDVTQTNVLALSTSQQSVSGISLHIRGRLDGKAHVVAGNWEKHTLSGTVDWQVYHDWFEPTCALHYEPVAVTSGSLTVEYEFH